jgi:NADH-quinone oxidoreductase subunit J
MVSFYILAAVIVFSALMVVTRRNPMHAALWLLVTFFALAGVYLLMNAEFVAAIQIIIYAGGVIVLYIFVIMLVDLSKEASLWAAFHKRVQLLSAIVFAVLIMAVVLWVSRGGIVPFSIGETPSVVSGSDTTRSFAKELFLTYLYPFEIASVLLLVAMIGSVILARRSRPELNSPEEKETR